jgi:PKD repeat protein
MVRLTQGNIMLIYQSNVMSPCAIYDNIYNASTLQIGSQEIAEDASKLPQSYSASDACQQLGYFSAVSDPSGNVYLSWSASYRGGTLFIVRTTSWGSSDSALQSYNCCTQITSETYSRVYNQVFIFTQTSEQATGLTCCDFIDLWIYNIGAATFTHYATDWNEPSDFTPSNGLYARPASFYQDYGGYIMFTYSANRNTPYEVKNLIFTEDVLCTPTANPTGGKSPVLVQFYSNCIGGNHNYSYNWNFGDGSTHSSAANPSHWYTYTWVCGQPSGTTYQPILTVTDSGYVVTQTLPPSISVYQTRCVSSPSP